jgi:hypothetical protein
MLIALLNSTSAGTLTQIELEQLVWALRYGALYHLNRSPWIEHGYVLPVDDLVLAKDAASIPGGAWPIELLDNCEDPGALGFHEDELRKSTAHSIRGALVGSPEIPLAKIGVKTSREDGVAPSEVADHELKEMVVDPFVSEAKVKVYKAPDGSEWAGEVCDPVQGDPNDVGAPEGRTCGVVLSNFVYPAFFGLAQTRTATSFSSDTTVWTKQTAPLANLAPFTIGPGGYASIRRNGQWEQINGEHAKPIPNPE